MDLCPHCGDPLSRAHLHCGMEDRKTPCDWLRCRCGAVVHMDGRFIPPLTERRIR